MLERFAVEPAPACWSEIVQPVKEIFASGLADPDAQVRIAAMEEIGRFWSWNPGRSMSERQEQALVAWKEGLHTPVVRCLGDREPQARVAAVACLGNLHYDKAAAVAIPYLEDRSQGAGPVRKQVLISFAQRPMLLSEDAILKRLHDPEPGIPETAELILSTRGLNRGPDRARPPDLRPQARAPGRGHPPAQGSDRYRPRDLAASALTR